MWRIYSNPDPHGGYRMRCSPNVCHLIGCVTIIYVINKLQKEYEMVIQLLKHKNENICVCAYIVDTPIYRSTYHLQMM
jgi:hypothetical protein